MSKNHENTSNIKELMNQAINNRDYMEIDRLVKSGANLKEFADQATLSRLLYQLVYDIGSSLFYDAINLARLLLENGADINHQYNGGEWTPLKAAAYYNNHSVIIDAIDLKCITLGDCLKENIKVSDLVDSIMREKNFGLLNKLIAEDAQQIIKSLFSSDRIAPDTIKYLVETIDNANLANLCAASLQQAKKQDDKELAKYLADKMYTQISGIDLKSLIDILTMLLNKGIDLNKVNEAFPYALSHTRTDRAQVPEFFNVYPISKITGMIDCIKSVSRAFGKKLAYDIVLDKIINPLEKNLESGTIKFNDQSEFISCLETLERIDIDIANSFINKIANYIRYRHDSVNTDIVNVVMLEKVLISSYKDALHFLSFVDVKGKIITKDKGSSSFLNELLLRHYGDRDGIEKLIDAGSDVNFVDPTGKSPLIHAIERGNKEIAEYLIKNKADVNFVDSTGKTPLVYAIERNNKNTIDCLIKNNADIDPQVLKLTMNCPHPAIVKIALTEIQQLDINSVLIAAVKNNYLETTKILIEHGADINCHDGHMPLINIALKNRNIEIAKVLTLNGANIDMSFLNSLNLDEHDIKNLLDGQTIKLLPTVYNQSDFEKISRLIFSELTPSQNEPVETVSAIEKLVIYNNKAFDAQENDRTYGSGDKYKQGNALNLDDGTPIGYNIHLPSGEITAILVSVYGGGRGGGKELLCYKPDALINLDKFLLANNVVIVKLNLTDLLVEYGFSQVTMTEELHKKVHESIHKIYQVIRNTPESLNDRLRELKGKPIFLEGSSFGGMNVERHAEKYPGSYNGYISFDGGLSTETLAKGDLSNADLTYLTKLIREYCLKSAAYLEPQNEKTDDRTPHLIIHNQNDNDVNVMVSILYCRDAKEAGKTMQVLFNKKGGNHFGDNKYAYSGHFHPKNKEDFNTMASKVIDFMHSKMEPEYLTDWHIREAQLYANWNYKSATLQEKFISAAYRMYKNIEGADGIVDRGIKFHNSLAIQDKSWDEYYKPLYLSLLYVDMMQNDDELLQKQIANSKNFSDEILANAIKCNFSDILEFISIKYGYDHFGTQQIAFEDIEDKKFLLDQYRLLLDDPYASKHLRLYLLKNIYMANPKLMGNECFKDIYNNPEIITKLDVAKADLINQLTEAYKEVLDIWKHFIIEQQKSGECVVNPNLIDEVILKLDSAKVDLINQLTEAYKEVLDIWKHFKDFIQVSDVTEQREPADGLIGETDEV